MKAIVFGGSGFIGSHVADVLDEKGYEVVVYDIKPSPYLRDTQKMIIGDILDEARVKEAVKGSNVIYNFAGISDIEEASKNPLESVKNNILGNAIILEACRKEDVKRFIFASSLYVFSKAGCFYRSTKQACELLIENYNEMFGLPYTILRYGSLYGPRSDENNFVYKIIKQALKERKITRYGDGEEVREYIHVRDATKGSVEILSEEFKNKHVIIIGNQQMKVKDLLFMIKEMLSNKIEIEFLPPKDSYHYEITPYSFTPKIGSRLTSQTHLDLSEGILEMINSLFKEVHPLPTYDGIMIENKNNDNNNKKLK